MLHRAANEKRFPGVIGTFMGRDALALAAQVLRLKPADVVLLPSYLCQEVVKPFLGRCRVEFYPLQPGLTVDPAYIRQRLATSTVRALVMINFFGFLDPRRQEIQALCAEKGTVLIEDCALSLLTEQSGETGDLAVYSFRKTLPVSDGGGLKINRGERPPAIAFRPQILSDLLSVCVMAKHRLRIRTEKLSRAGLSTPPAGPVADTAPQESNARILPLSSFSRRAIQRVPTQPITERAREDFLFWAERVKRSNRCVPIYDSLPPGVCPLGFPIRIENRNEVRAELQQRGVYLKVHWRMPAAVGSGFPESHALSAQMITLPVYPELVKKEREEIVKVLGLE